MLSILAMSPLATNMAGYGNYGMMGTWGNGYAMFWHWIFGIIILADLVLVGIWLIQKITKK